MKMLCHHVPKVLFAHCFLATMAAMAAGTNLSTDESALLEFKSSITLDPDNVLTYNWSSSSPVCNWYGISCSARHDRVTTLNLTNMGLQGRISPHLGNLSFLRAIILDGNNFNGILPRELSYLPRLEVINLRANRFVGDFPSWFANLTSLQIMNLNNNSFSGSIPVEIGNLPGLRILNLQYNKLSGAIPFSIFNMSSLEILALTSNRLTGSLPDNICHKFQKLEGLFLSENDLNGQIPSSFGECSNLEVLSLSVNGFTGRIPKDIGNLTALEQIFLGTNYLTGAIPLELGQLNNLEALSIPSNNLDGFIPPTIFNLSAMNFFDVSGNKLSGQIPPSIDLPNLELISLAINKFTGTLPASISNSSKLTVLYLFNNSFSGPFPTLWNLRMLQRVDISFNNFTADSSFFTSLTSCRLLDTLQVSVNPLNVVLPISIGNMSSIQYLMAGSCNIKGSIPVEVSNLNTMIQLELSENKLTGSIPSAFGRLRQLQGLSISGNKLRGPIPTEICHLENLNYLFLNNNELSGQIPACLRNLTSLRQVYLQNNNLSSIPLSFWSLTYLLRLNLSSNDLNGSLPLDIGNLKVLTHLDLSRNQISGTIPSTIGGLRDLQHLSLAENDFQGSIPQSFGNLVGLVSLNLSTNNLSGSIPKSLEALSELKSFDVSSNRLQGEIPSGGPFGNFSYASFKSNGALCGSPRFQVPPCETSTPKKSKAASVRLLKYILPPVASLSLIIAFTIIYIKSRKKNLVLEKQEDMLPLPTWKRISFLQLQEATDGFSEDNLLGIGSFGSVYKGSLSDGTNVAAKVFNLQVEGVLESFDTECEVMRNIRHRNLVKVISSCCNPDFKALILEFMPNGSLEKWLYSDNCFLDIPHMMNILIDVASALEYLHCYPTPIIHCDLKPNNILLDKDMVAHVGDFGIAKLLAGESCITQTLTLATIGYMAPEYGQAGIVSTRGDVYSYGILMMETFTRKKPTDEMFSGEMSMKQWVKNSLPDAVTEIVDSNLLDVEGNRRYIAEINSVSSILELALNCSADLPEERMRMEDVVSTLKKIKRQFLMHLSQV